MPRCSNTCVKTHVKGTGLEVCGLEVGPTSDFSEEDNGLPVAIKCGTFHE